MKFLFCSLLLFSITKANESITLHSSSVNKPLIISNEKVTYDVKSMKSVKCLGQQNINEKWRKEMDVLTSFSGDKFSLTKFIPIDDTALFDYVEPTSYTFSRKLKSEVSEGPYALLNYNNITTEYQLIEQHSNRNNNGFKKLDVYRLSDMSEKEALAVKGGIMIYETTNEWTTVDGRIENQQASAELKFSNPQKKQKTMGMSKPRRIVFKA